MNQPATTITQGCLQDLYHQRPHPLAPVVQILAHQPSDYNPKEIILRISDRLSFVDCLLVGPYALHQHHILSNEYSRAVQTFSRYDVVKLTDYYCKVDPSRICPLKIIVRKLEPVAHADSIAGRPEEISQFIENANDRPHNQINPIRAKISLPENKHLLNLGTEDTPIKVEEMVDEPAYPSQHHEQTRERPTVPQINAAATMGYKEQDPLCLADIMNGKQGFFVGRLIRIKFGSKDAKDGPMSFLYLGLVDINGDLVRIHLAGRIALKESRELKKGKVYFIKGIELFQGDKTKGPPQIRLKDKQYKISQILNESIKAQYKHSYYRWEHQSEWIESEMSVDIIGIVEEIEEKITYRNANTYQEQRDVVRLVLRNALKLTKISFWADHINILRSLELKKKQPILIQDIKKKKAVFLDFTAESNIVMLDDFPQLKEELAELLPPISEAPDPTNIREYQQVNEIEPFSAKIRTLYIKISNINSKWITYKMCNDCKKKVEKILQICPQCQKNDFVFKYNCPIELTDSTGSLNSVAFDGICDKLFGYNALQFSKLSEADIKSILESILYSEYKVNIESKNNRLILRSIEKQCAPELLNNFLQQSEQIQPAISQ